MRSLSSSVAVVRLRLTEQTKPTLPLSFAHLLLKHSTRTRTHTLTLANGLKLPWRCPAGAILDAARSGKRANKPATGPALPRARFSLSLSLFFFFFYIYFIKLAMRPLPVLCMAKTRFLPTGANADVSFAATATATATLVVHCCVSGRASVCQLCELEPRPFARVGSSQRAQAHSPVSLSRKITPMDLSLNLAWPAAGPRFLIGCHKLHSGPCSSSSFLIGHSPASADEDKR